MVTIAHSVLAGTEIHEPKGVAAAALGQVYVADGNGSGNWSGIGTSSFTGMISDFVWPVVQDGWLELDGSDINTSTYSALYDVMTIQMTGTRVVSTATITSLSSTSNMRVGFYVFGTGIASGTTVASIDSGTQITLSTNVSSSGTSSVIVSPWLLNTGTIRLPDVSSAGRYRRSRTSSTRVGQLQNSQNLSHTHTGSGTTSPVSNDHSHTFSGTSGTENQSLSHSHPYTAFDTRLSTGYSLRDSGPPAYGASFAANTSAGGPSAHNHNYAGTTSGVTANHTHTYSFGTAGSGGTESNPISLVVMTCVKT